MKPLALNLLTSSVTLLVLVALTLPAKWALAPPAAEPPAVSAVPAAWPRPATEPERVFGVYTDPWHLDDWARSLGVAPQLVAKFEAFSLRRTLDAQLAQLERDRVSRFMITWEPWTPVPAAYGTGAQSAPQPGYRNVDIASGIQDEYLTRFARSLAGFDGTVYLRYAHEMNGYWYPWSTDPRAYVSAWRRMVRIFAAAGADNVRFVWSPNPNLYEGEHDWRAGVVRYWPGAQYVDDVGSTMIDFGGVKAYPVRRFVPRLQWLRRRFDKPVLLTETNAAYEGRLAWLADLHVMLDSRPWISAVVWSQLPSRGTVQQRGTGVLDWDAQRDPAAAAQLAAIIRDGVR